MSSEEEEKKIAAHEDEEDESTVKDEEEADESDEEEFEDRGISTGSARGAVLIEDGERDNRFEFWSLLLAGEEEAEEGRGSNNRGEPESLSFLSDLGVVLSFSSRGVTMPFFCRACFSNSARPRRITRLMARFHFCLG
jgi:hypothetical protein